MKEIFEIERIIECVRNQFPVFQLLCQKYYFFGQFNKESKLYCQMIIAIKTKLVKYTCSSILNKLLLFVYKVEIKILM